jgi:hypothetical protein
MMPLLRCRRCDGLHVVLPAVAVFCRRWLTSDGLATAWRMGEYDFIIVAEAPDDETAATLVLRVGAAGNVRSKTMRAFDADQMSDIIARTG